MQYILTLALLVPGITFAAAPDFNAEVLPVFRKYCNGCHNSREQEGGLVLENFARLSKGGDSGPAFVAGESVNSRLWQAISGDEPAMPPKDSPRPKPEELAVIKAWIDAGAPGPKGAAAMGLVTRHIAPTAAVREPVTALAADPQGKFLAVARPNHVEIVRWPGRELVADLKGHTGAIADVQFSKTGDRLLVAAGESGLSGEATIWNTADWSRRLTLTGHADALYGAAFSPAGDVVATASYDRTLKTWNAATGTELVTLAGHNDAVYGLAFHPSGKLLASASGDRTVKLWDVATGARLDTFIQPAKEQYSVSMSPDGRFIAAGGVDNRVRVWEITAGGKEGTNPIRYARFAHEAPIERVLFSPDGKLLVSCSQERRIKVWETQTFTQVALLERQTDWPSAACFTSNSRELIIGRMDGSLGIYPVDANWADSPEAQTRLPESPLAEPSTAAPGMNTVAEVEPNDAATTAIAVTLPATITGRFHAEGGKSDPDCYRFEAKAGQTWIFETNAARQKSPADTKLEILHADGTPVRRALLQAVRDSWINFRPIDSSQLQVRVEYWEEMDLNQFLYMNGEIAKFHRAPRGPDSGYDFYENRGKRRTYFDTTPITHAKDEPVYIVEAYPPTAKLVDNGLPVFPLDYINDDDGERELGSDSRLTFTAPQDGAYIVRATDARGFGGEDYRYELLIRAALPDFVVNLDTPNVKVPAGGGQRLKFFVDRKDSFNDPIRIDVANLPPGFHVSEPTVIEAGQLEAYCVLTAADDAETPTKEAWDAVTVDATALIHGVPVTRRVGTLGQVVLEKPNAVRAYLVPDELDIVDADGGLILKPGTTITAMIRVERNGFDDDVKFDVDNLPHGVIVDNIGLSGVLVRKNETERQIFLTARPWVPDSTRWIHAVGQIKGNPASPAIRLHIRSDAKVASGR